MDWNHFAFSVQGRTMRVHINGLEAGESPLNNSVISNQSSFCFLGNNAYFQDPFNGHIRHLVFYNQGFQRNQNIMNTIRVVPLPNDTSVLAYYQFQEGFNSQETYHYSGNASLSLSAKMTIEQSGEPEFVCYCIKPAPDYLRVSTDFRIQQFDFSPVQSVVDQKGVTIRFTIFALNYSSGQDTIVFQIQNYIDVVLMGPGNNLRVDIYGYSNQVVDSAILWYSRMRYNFWSSYELVINSNDVILYVDGRFEDTQGFNAALTNRTGTKLLIMPSPSRAFTFLLYNLTINVPNNTNFIFTQIFTQDVVGSSLKIAYGTPEFQSNNKLCSQNDLYNPLKFVAGSTCAKPRMSAAFNQTSSITGLSGKLNSSMTNMTFEVWFKVLNNSNGSKVILQNFDGWNYLAQIALISESNQGQTIQVNNQYSQQPNSVASLNTVGNFLNQWIHLAVISSSLGIKITMFNQTSQAQNSSFTQGLSFIQQNSLLNTSLGSALNGSNKFDGFLREVRIWAMTKSDQDVMILRYSTATLVSEKALDGSKLLVHHFRLNDDLFYSTLYDSVDYTPSLYMSDKSPTLSSFIWFNDTALTICGLGYYFDGQCCQQFTLSGIDFILNYDQSGQFIDFSIINHSMAPLLFQSIQADFALISVGNNFDINYTQQISSLILTYKKQQYSIHVSLILPLLYNITVEATLYSLYDIKSININKTLVLQCPSFYLTVNNLSYSSDNLYVVSNSPNHQVAITLNTVDNQCFNPQKNQTQTIPVSKPQWSFNQTRLSFQQAFTISPDGFTAVQNSNVQGLSQTRVTAKSNYAQSSYTFVFLNLLYQPIAINNGYQGVQIMGNYVQNQVISFDFTSANISAIGSSGVQNNPLSFSVTCPTQIFQDLNQYIQSCQMNGPVFTLQTRSLSIQYSYQYLLTFMIAIQGTYIMRELLVNTTFYKDGTGLAYCPIILYQNQYIYDKVSMPLMQITPDPYLYCSGVFYQIQNASWTVFEQVSKQVLPNFVNQLSQYPISFFLMKDNPNVQRVSGGTVLLMNGQFQFKEASANQYLNFPMGSFNQTAVVQINYTEIQPIVTLLSQTNEIMNTSQIPFTEEFVTLSAINSYDPDNSSVLIEFLWECPLEINNCSSLDQGPKNQTLMFGIWTRFNSNLSYDRNYTFKLTAYEPNNALRVPQTTSFNLSFNPPYPGEYNTLMTNTSCESLSLSSLEFQALKNGNIIEETIFFTIANQSLISVGINDVLDHGLNVRSSPCNTGNVTEQLIFLQVFENYSQANPQLIFSQDSSTPIQKQVNFIYTLSDQADLKVIPYNQLYKAAVYMFTLRAGSSKTYLNTQNFWLMKQEAGLVAQFTNPDNYTVDKYQDLVLDASASFDEEKGQRFEFTYIWLCPPSLLSYCATVTLPTLTLSYPLRENAGLNIVDLPTQYGVQIQNSSYYKSFPAYTFVTVTLKSNYSSCMNSSITGSLVGSNFFNNNQTLFLEYGMSQNVSIQVNVQSLCQYMNVKPAIWQTFNASIDPFWTASDGNQIVLNGTQIDSIPSGQTVTVIYSKGFTMGNDSQTYSISTFVNFFVNLPELQVILTGNQIVLNGADSSIFINGSASYDPLGLPIEGVWTCPFYFGGQNCSNRLTLNLTLAGANNISQLLNMAYSFRLTIASLSDSRNKFMNYTVYLSDGQSPPFNQQGIESCQISFQGGTETIKFLDFNAFKLDCNSSNVVGSVFNSNFTWNVSGLAQGKDYYTVQNILYIRPYAAAKLQKSNVQINLVQMIPIAVTGNTTNTLRMLQTNGNDSNNTSSSVNTTNQNTSAISYIYVPSSQIYIGKAIPLMRNILKQGSISITAYPYFVAYTSNFSFYFTNFSTSSPSQVLFQLRAYQQFYKAQVTLIPIKTLDSKNIMNFYTLTQLPASTDLFVDFFDLGLNYLGSYNLMEIQQIQYMAVSSIQWTQYNDLLYTIIQKTLSSYSSLSGIVQFEKDIYTLLNLVEMLANNLVNTVLSGSFNSYPLMITAYLELNLQQTLAQFDNYQEFTMFRSKANIQKQVLLIIYNLMQINTGIQYNMLTILSIFESMVSDYDSMFTNSTDQEIVRSITLQIAQILCVQILSSGLTNKQQYIQALEQAKMSVAVNDIIYSSQSNQQSVVVNLDKISRTVYQVYNNSTSLQVVNNLNNLESVIQPSQDSLFSLGVNWLIVDYSQDLNTSSALNSVLSVKAFNSSKQQIPVQVDSPQSNFQFSFQLNETLRQMINNVSANITLNYTYQLGCVYFDFTHLVWSTAGMKTESYNNQTGIINCQSSHLSQFSVIYQQVARPAQITYRQNSTTANNETQSVVSEASFYKRNPAKYGVAVGLTTGGVIILALVSLCCKYESNKVKIDNFEGATYSFATKFKCVLKIFHPLSAAFITMKSSALAVPRVYHMITLWIYIFAVVLSTLIGVQYIVNRAFSTDQVVVYAVVFQVVLIILRPIHSSVVFNMYHWNTRQEKEIKNESREIARTENLSQGNRADNYRISDPQMFEGGESNDEFEEDHDVSSDHSEGNNPGSDRRFKNKSDTLDNDRKEEFKSSQGLVGPKYHQETLKTSRLYNIKEYGRSPEQKIEGQPESPQMSGVFTPGQRSQTMREYSTHKNYNSDFNGKCSLQQLLDLNEIAQRHGPQQQEGFPHQNYNCDDEIPVTFNRSLPKKTEIAFRKRSQIVVESEHNFKGTRCCLLLLQIFILFGLMAATYGIMRDIETAYILGHWIYEILGVFGVYCFIIDTLRIFLFTVIFQGKITKFVRISAFFLLGNSTQSGLLSLQFELNACQ